MALGGSGITGSHPNTVSTSNTSTLTVTAPTGVINGSLLLMALETSQSVTPSPPADWTAFSISPVLGGSTSALYLWYKVAANESGNYTVSFTGTGSPVAVNITNWIGVDTAVIPAAANLASSGGGSVTSEAISAPSGPLSGAGLFGVAFIIGGARPAATQTSFTITMPDNALISSNYSTPGGGVGAALAGSYKKTTPSGNVTTSHSGDISTAVIYMQPVMLTPINQSQGVNRATNY